MKQHNPIRMAGISLSLLISAIATWLMLQPGQPDALPGLPHIDKLAHFITFFVITLPAVAVHPARWFWIVLAASALGGAIEIIQPWFGRSRELADFIADVAGALLAVPVGRWLSERWQLHKRHRA